MTSHIQQHVVPRHRRKGTIISFTNGGNWKTRPLRTTRFFTSSSLPTSRRWSAWQRGSVTQSTLTVGVGVAAIIGVVVVSFFYLQQVFGTAAHGSDIQQLEQQVVQLKEKQAELELEGASLRSIQSVEERVQRLNLVSADAVAYLPATPDRVALSNTASVR